MLRSRLCIIDVDAMLNIFKAVKILMTTHVCAGDLLCCHNTEPLVPSSFNDFSLLFSLSSSYGATQNEIERPSCLQDWLSWRSI